MAITTLSVPDAQRNSPGVRRSGRRPSLFACLRHSATRGCERRFAREAEAAADLRDGALLRVPPSNSQLVGHQTRTHDDLDLVVAHDKLAAAATALSELGYRHDATVAPGLPARMVLLDAGRQIDLHPVVLDAEANGWQPLGGGAWGGYPADSCLPPDRSSLAISASAAVALPRSTRLDTAVPRGPRGTTALHRESWARARNDLPRRSLSIRRRASSRVPPRVRAPRRAQR